MYMESNSELEEDNIIIRGLTPGEIYEFKVIAVDGDFMSESDPEEVETYSVGTLTNIFLYYAFKKRLFTSRNTSAVIEDIKKNVFDVLLRRFIIILSISLIKIIVWSWPVWSGGEPNENWLFSV